MRDRLLRDEDGFTLTEVLVTMMMMILVMFALYSIFDMSIRVFKFGNDKVEAVENARIGLFKMEREIRAAYPQDKANDVTDLLFSPSDANQIIFGLDDVVVNQQVDAGEKITYKLDSDTLTRTKGGGLPQPAVEFVTELQFGYLDEFGYCVNSATPTLPPCPATVPTEAELRNAEIVNIKFTVNKDGRTQTLQTDVSLRNRNT